MDNSKLLILSAERMGLTRNEVLRIVLTAHKRYKTYKIRKRSGGERTIAQPARELKDIQYLVIDELLSKLPIHEAATAYRAGSSIKNNLTPHLGAKAILKMDFKDFFGSIKQKDFVAYCSQNLPRLMEDDVAFCKQVLFWRGNGREERKLSIGAPSSPILSNIMMFEFDRQIAGICSPLQVTYTRYADDLTFSSSDVNQVKKLTNVVTEVLSTLPYPKIYVNWDKTRFVTRQSRMSVTGLILSNQGSVSIGHEKKRYLRSVVYRYTKNQLNMDEIENLRGQLAYVKSVEPGFIERLSSKYGSGVVQSIFKKNFTSRRK